MRIYSAFVVGMLVVAATLWLTQAVEAGPAPSDVPYAIRVPDHNKVFLVGRADLAGERRQQ